MMVDSFGRIAWGHFQLEGRPIYYEIVEREGREVLQACELGRGGPAESFPPEWRPAIDADIARGRHAASPLARAPAAAADVDLARDLLILAVLVKDNQAGRDALDRLSDRLRA
jgi:hypothetical protein